MAMAGCHAHLAKVGAFVESCCEEDASNLQFAFCHAHVDYCTVKWETSSERDDICNLAGPSAF